MRAISLFAGAGGCSLGFKNAGVNIIAAFENAQPAIATYNANFGEGCCQCVDLSSCNFYSLREQLGLRTGELDMMIGGPPCQGFTTAGGRFWDDPRNALVINYADALSVFFPKWFVMENVEGILTTAGGSYLFECVKKMVELGYSVYLKKVYMHEYGVPQRRKRVIIVGNRDGKRFSFPQPVSVATGAIYKHSSATLRTAIGDLESACYIDLDHLPRSESGLRLERIQNLQQGQTMKDLPERLQHGSFKRRAFRRVCDGQLPEKRGGAPSGLKRLIYDEPSLTITSASPSEFVHPSEDRMLTLRECARIQTFPDNYIFKGTVAQKALQIGNAIPPLFAQQLAQQIIQCNTNAPNEVKAGLLEFEVTKSEAMSPALQRTVLNLQRLAPNIDSIHQLSLNI